MDQLELALWDAITRCFSAPGTKQRPGNAKQICGDDKATSCVGVWTSRASKARVATSAQGSDSPRLRCSSAKSKCSLVRPMSSNDKWERGIIASLLRHILACLTEEDW